MWHTIRIWFADNIWTVLFPPDETQRLLMTGRLLKMKRVQFGLTPKSMAEMLCVPLSQYKKWEERGLYGPHDTEGPAFSVINVISRILEKRQEQKEILDILGYKGKMD